MQQAKTFPIDILTPEDIEYALRLLPKEHKPHWDWSTIIGYFLGGLIANGALIGLFGGLVTIWFNRQLGIRLFLLFGMALVILLFYGFFIWFINTKFNKKFIPFDLTKFKLEDSEIGRAASKIWENRSSNVTCIASFLGLLGLTGCAWLTFGIIRYGELIPLALLLTFIPYISSFILFGILLIQEEHFYRNVIEVRGMLEAKTAEEWSTQDINFATPMLSKYEEDWIKQTIQQVSNEREEGNYYGVLIYPEPRKSIEQIISPQIKREIDEAIFNLQSDPVPEGSQRLEDEEIYFLQGVNFAITYKVDPPQRRLEVLSISITNPRETSRGI